MTRRCVFSALLGLVGSMSLGRRLRAQCVPASLNGVVTLTTGEVVDTPCTVRVEVDSTTGMVYVTQATIVSPFRRDEVASILLT